MLTAVPADDSASANLPSACSHAQMFERKRPSSIGAPFAIKSDSWYIASACWWFPWKNASLPSSLNSETLFARSRSCDRPSGSGMDASSASAASSSFSSSSSFSFSFASPPASSRFLFFSSAALSAGSICKRSTTCSPASTHDVTFPRSNCRRTSRAFLRALTLFFPFTMACASSIFPTSLNASARRVIKSGTAGAITIATSRSSSAFVAAACTSNAGSASAPRRRTT